MIGIILKKLLRKFHKDPTSETLSRFHLSSKSLLESWRTWRFLINLEVVSDDRNHPSEASVKVLSRSNIRNLAKTSLSFKFLPGVMEDMEVPD